MQILIINGPNLNMLGIREPEIYGQNTYDDLCNFISQSAAELEVKASIFQSNHEGAIVDCIQSAFSVYDGIIINPAAFTHTSVAILDALKAVGLPTVEVHLSDINMREDFRKTSFVSLYCEKCFSGFGFDGYKRALTYLKDRKTG